MSRSAATKSTLPPASAIRRSRGKDLVQGQWYWNGIPLVILHGVPGYSIYLKASGQAEGRKIVRYDQLGSGNRQCLRYEMFTIPHFVAELEALRAPLGMTRSTFSALPGGRYSRSSTIARTRRVASRIQASPARDIPAWEAHARNLIRTLPIRPARDREARGGKKTTKRLISGRDDGVLQQIRMAASDQPDRDSMFAGANMGIYIYMYDRAVHHRGYPEHYDGTPYLKTSRSQRMSSAMS